ncbi:hypothetical protein KUTeg_004951 [Tegillarca granosa]|uniref:Uncharacterized protein n=1 Tax=Tegillarca granosa TaxID=220873 RepID=A0ABQ9FIC7_TEGGR|nr:hypothetical protein KUTeg_004951 [Tegillarca granosa]
MFPLLAVIRLMCYNMSKKKDMQVEYNWDFVGHHIKTTFLPIQCQGHVDVILFYSNEVDL